MRAARPGRSAPVPGHRPHPVFVIVACLMMTAATLVHGAAPIAGQDGATPAASPLASPVATPGAGIAGRLDLASMALDAADLPEGFALLAESYATADDWVATTFPGDTTTQQTASSPQQPMQMAQPSRHRTSGCAG